MEPNAMLEWSAPSPMCMLTEPDDVDEGDVVCTEAQAGKTTQQHRQPAIGKVQVTAQSQGGTLLRLMAAIIFEPTTGSVMVS